MHCPRCGQKQVTDETKFCSRCGFLLSLVPELIANGGTLPQLASLEAKPPILNKKNGVFFAVFWFIFFTMFLTALGGILDDEGILPAITAVVGVFGSFLILLFSLVFLPSSKKKYRLGDPGIHSASHREQFLGSSVQGNLPPASSQPASVYSAPQGAWRVPDTGDLAVPGSVTENTTKLLAKDREEDR